MSSIAPPLHAMNVAFTANSIPVLWSPYGGALRAKLYFRVGQADETVVSRGATHLAEHLALSALGQPTYSFNGAVEQNLTSFEVTGSPDEVVHHLAALCRSLHRLPLERFEQERQVLRVEGGGLSGTPAQLRRTRFGLRGYGMPTIRELGLFRLTGEAVQAWSHRVFNAGNAVLWLSGPPPSNLDLPLPTGPRYRAPEPTSLPVTGPSWYEGESDGAGLTALCESSLRADAGVWWLNRLLHHRLRVQHGHSYSAHAEREKLTAAVSELAIFADGLPESADALVAGISDVIRHSTSSPMPDSELDAWRRSMVGALDEPTAVLGLLDRNARRLLLGEPLQSAEELRAAIAAVTPGEVQEQLRRAMSTAIFELPSGAAGLTGWQHYPAPQARDVGPGQVFVPARHLPPGDRLTISPAGVYLQAATGEASSIHWETCHAVLKWPDEHRALIADEWYLRLDPTQWHDGRRMIAEVDRVAPRQKTIEMPAADNDESMPPVGLSGLAAVSTGPLAVLVVGIGLLFALLAAALHGPGVNALAAGIVLAAVGALEAWFAWSLVRRLRTPKRARARRLRSRTDVGVDTALARAAGGTLLGVAAGAWALAVLIVVFASARGVAFWPAIPVAGFALRSTFEYRRRQIRR